MGLFDRLRKKAAAELIEIIDWMDDEAGALVHRFPSAGRAIKLGAQLTVRENQAALLVNEGKAADLFRPGLHSLVTRNIPILTTLKGWKYGFESPFKAEVYFFNLRLMADQKWGTTQPVMMRDAELGMIRLRAFGTYAFRIKDPVVFFRTLVGTRGLTTSDDITGQLRSEAVGRFSDAAAESKIAALDLASRYEELAAAAGERLEKAFSSYGLELVRFVVENISLPEEVQSAIDQRSRLALLGDRLAEFAQLQTAEAMTLAAGTPGGAAAAGIGLGAGAAVGQMMSQAMAAPRAAVHSASAAPPAQPAAGAPLWSLSLAGRPAGPYTDQEIRGMLAAGHLSSSTLASKGISGEWAPLSSWPEFAGGK